MISRWSLQRSRYLAIVISSFIPFIWKAPSPTSAKTGRSGCANLAAIAYGTPGPIVASVPESDPIIPFRILMSRAYQLAAEPESEVRIAPSGSRFESSKKTRCGLVGSASSSARRSIRSPQSRAPADQDRDLLALVQNASGALELCVLRHDLRARVADPGVDGSVLVRRRVDGLLRGEVVRDDDARDRALVEGDAHGAVDEVANLRRVGGHVHVLVGDVLEERRQVDLLLVVAAQRRHGLLADDRDDGLVVELGVVEAVQEVDGAWAGGGDTDADLTGELRVAAGHERRHLLVPDLDEPRVAAGAPE